MKIHDILQPDGVTTHADFVSKKGVLEHLSKMLSASVPQLSSAAVFDGLVARERLGSTGLGAGIAIPHVRLANQKITKGVFLSLRHPVDYDAIDNRTVDLFFAMFVPAEATDEHLKMLATLAETLSNDKLLERLRKLSDSQEIYRLLTQAGTCDSV